MQSEWWAAEPSSMVSSPTSFSFVTAGNHLIMKYSFRRLSTTQCKSHTHTHTHTHYCCAIFIKSYTHCRLHCTFCFDLVLFLKASFLAIVLRALSFLPPWAYCFMIAVYCHVTNSLVVGIWAICNFVLMPTVA